MKSINIASSVYAIRYVENPVDGNEDPGDGVVDFKKKIIEIDRNMGKQQKNRSVIHEIIEAMNHEYYIGLRHKQIELLECAIYDTFKRNDLTEVFK